jgi:copper chaperone CopZ
MTAINTTFARQSARAKLKALDSEVDLHNSKDPNHASRASDRQWHVMRHRVTAALKDLPGVGGAEVTLATGKVDVSYDERLAQPAPMNSAAERSGYSAGAATIGAQSKGCCCKADSVWQASLLSGFILLW